jgi:hypothetical protein
MRLVGDLDAALGRYVVFQMAEVAVPRELFPEILRLDLLCDEPTRLLSAVPRSNKASRS